MTIGYLEIEYDEREFTSYAHWINKASTWLASDQHGRFVCVAADGKICRSGADFKNAAYPVRFGQLVCGNDRVSEEDDEVRLHRLDCERDEKERLQRLEAVARAAAQLNRVWNEFTDLLYIDQPYWVALHDALVALDSDSQPAQPPTPIDQLFDEVGPALVENLKHHGKREMDADQAVAILNQHKHRGATNWQLFCESGDWWVDGDVNHPTLAGEKLAWSFSEEEVIAIAGWYQRQQAGEAQPLATDRSIYYDPQPNTPARQATKILNKYQYQGRDDWRVYVSHIDNKNIIVNGEGGLGVEEAIQIADKLRQQAGEGGE